VRIASRFVMSSGLTVMMPAALTGSSERCGEGEGPASLPVDFRPRWAGARSLYVKGSGRRVAPRPHLEVGGHSIITPAATFHGPQAVLTRLDGDRIGGFSG
jgi:hypothetical protein